MPSNKKRFVVSIQNEALQHLQDGINYYNKEQKGLGKRFEAAVHQTIKHLYVSPFYQVRYDDIRCLPVKNFPYMLHFRVNEDEKMVRIYGIIHISTDPATHRVLH